ncbi:hypothetical protein SUGI_1510420 [Cryptomeria japonica]|uniref:Uncharacterized protein n=1 Tax=Cryptomeria japonica TaxID=3369 RepID=A0AAD3NT69_CRYJA|nr:hypothetical protein SUGI_1499890 [Cryptomeria japonica]GLJ59484.1 hypothetical protein SUGI_1510420 [Cryptomeria japonica]
MPYYLKGGAVTQNVWVVQPNEWPAYRKECLHRLTLIEKVRPDRPFLVRLSGVRPSLFGRTPALHPSTSISKWWAGSVGCPTRNVEVAALLPSLPLRPALESRG